MQNAILSEEATRVCSICKTKFTLNNYYKNSNGSYDYRCKQCLSLLKADKYRLAKTKQKTKITRKRYTTCEKVLGLKRFPVYAPSKDGHANICWDCRAEQMKLNTNPQKYWWRKACVVNRFGSLKITAEELLDIFISQSELCYYCYVPLNEDNINVEHKLPLSKGGDNNKNNLAVSCKDCNLLKHDKTEKEFKIFLTGYVERIVANSRPKAT